MNWTAGTASRPSDLCAQPAEHAFVRAPRNSILTIRTRNRNKFLIPKIAISGRDTLSLDPSIKTYTDAILQIKLICRYICCHTILLYVYVYELCIKELNDETMIGASFVIQPCACDRNVPVTVGGSVQRRSMNRYHLSLIDPREKILL